MNKGIDNDEIFIIGGGPSLKGFPFERLRDKNTIAVNVAAFDVPNPTYCITGDSSIFRKIQEGHFKGIDTTWVMVIGINHPVIKFRDGKLQRMYKHSARSIHPNYIYNPLCVDMLIRYTEIEGLGFSFKDFRTGYNSGFSAFQLAILLRYKKIYLLGFDLNPNPVKCHYHNRYKHRSISSENLNQYYNNFRLAFKILKRERPDIEVFSCSKGSRLNQHIPYVSFKDVL